MNTFGHLKIKIGNKKMPLFKEKQNIYLLFFSHKCKIKHFPQIAKVNDFSLPKMYDPPKQFSFHIIFFESKKFRYGKTICICSFVNMFLHTSFHFNFDFFLKFFERY